MQLACISPVRARHYGVCCGWCVDRAERIFHGAPTLAGLAWLLPEEPVQEVYTSDECDGIQMLETRLGGRSSSPEPLAFMPFGSKALPGVISPDISLD